MQLYRLAEGENQEGWPFLRAGHAFLADGTPLTESDDSGRIVPARQTPDLTKATCSGGQTGLHDHQRGIESLARALNDGDAVRAPLLLLHLQIDPNPSLSKFNPWHRGPGPGGGQFTSGPDAGGDFDPSAIEPAGQSMGVDYTSTYRPGEDPTADIAHEIMTRMVQRAILAVGNLEFRPGMPGYGQALHLALSREIEALHDPMFQSEPIYLDGMLIENGPIPPGASRPDAAYGLPNKPAIVFELKSGRAADENSAANVEQRSRTIANLPKGTRYDYFFVRER